MRLDPVDEKIITLLVEDARRSFADIGGRVGLTASAVKRRVDRLRAGGAIGGFTVRLEPEALGLDGRGLRRALLPQQHVAAGDPDGHRPVPRDRRREHDLR